MGPIIKLLILTLFALATDAASVARQMISYGNASVARQAINYGKFSDYCTYPMYINKDGSSTFDADCSSKVGGANDPGAQLANSQLDFNDCFLNEDGKLKPFKGGSAMKSCTCDIGYSVCGSDCPNTSMRCQCKDYDGNLVTGDIFDIGDYIKVVWSDEHDTNLLVCPSAIGDTVGKYQGCTKDGATLETSKCPS